jgi:predicted tellurium resistance membrane protein TerC
VEIHQGSAPAHRGRGRPRVGKIKASFSAIIVQIIIIDMVFSLDSIITAVGMVDEVA